MAISRDPGEGDPIAWMDANSAQASNLRLGSTGETSNQPWRHPMKSGTQHGLQVLDRAAPLASQEVFATKQLNPAALPAVTLNADGAELAAPVATANAASAETVARKVRVRVITENSLLHEALSRMTARCADFEMLAGDFQEPFRVELLAQDPPDILLLASRGDLDGDVSVIRKIRNTVPSVHIVLFGGVGAETGFLQYVRAGIRGYLPLGASAENVIDALKAVHSGSAFCPGSLCSLLFRYFEREATTVPSAAMHQRLGLTRREQQLVPLIAQGLTNKQIADRFSLCEQTVKNHLYRMKHKVGADDRLGIVQTCHTQGFLL